MYSLNNTIKQNNKMLQKVTESQMAGPWLSETGFNLNISEISKVSGGAACLQQDMQTGAAVGYKLLGNAGIGIGALAGAIYHFAVEP
jgi:hypothetical protein